MASVIVAEMLRVPLLAMAAVVPVRVSVHWTAPAEVTVGRLQEEVMPFGKPEMMLTDAPVAPVGTVTPPTGLAVTVSVAVPIDAIDSFEFSVIVIPGACSTCSA